MSAKLLATMTRMLFASIPPPAASREEPAPKLWPVTRMPGSRNCGWLSTKSGSSLPSSRRRDDGSEDPDFVLNQPQFRDPGILVTGHNFGAGSSREAAGGGMLANNIRVIVARSFADIYRENCLQNGLLPIVLEAGDAAAFADRVVAVNGAAPFTVDLRTQRITGPGGADISFDIPAADRMRL